MERLLRLNDFVILFLVCTHLTMVSGLPPDVNIPRYITVKEDVPIGSIIGSFTAIDPEGLRHIDVVTGSTAIVRIEESTTQPGNWSIILNTTLDREVNQSLRAWAFDAETGSQTTWQAFSEDEPLTIPANCWNEKALPSLPCLFFVSPAIVTNGVTVHLCGENKFVPLSSQRVVNVNTTAGVVVTLQGQPGEKVTFTYYVNDDRRIADVTVLGQGTAVVSLNLTVPLTTPAPTSAGPTTIFSSTPNRAHKHRSSLQNCLVLLIAVMFIKNYGYYSSF